MPLRFDILMSKITKNLKESHSTTFAHKKKRSGEANIEGYFSITNKLYRSPFKFLFDFYVFSKNCCLATGSYIKPNTREVTCTRKKELFTKVLSKFFKIKYNFGIVSKFKVHDRKSDAVISLFEAGRVCGLTSSILSISNSTYTV